MPIRQPRHVLLFGFCCSITVVGAVLGVLYTCYAPNTDVVVLMWLFVGVLLWPLWKLTVLLWGEQVLQVEHAGVVVSRYLWGMRLSRKVLQADEVRHFDWEASSDGVYTLRLIIRHADGRLSPLSVLQTPSPYAITTVLRDLELHYPGSGLYVACPSLDIESVGTPRWGSYVSLLFGVGVACWLLPQVWRPLYVATTGQVSPAMVVSVEWAASPRPGAPYYLNVRPRGSEEIVKTASAFSVRSAVPLEGQTIPVLWKTGQMCYLPGEVLPFVMPLPVVGACLLLIWMGCWGLMLSKRHPR